MCAVFNIAGFDLYENGKKVEDSRNFLASNSNFMKSGMAFVSSNSDSGGLPSVGSVTVPSTGVSVSPSV